MPKKTTRTPTPITNTTEKRKNYQSSKNLQPTSTLAATTDPNNKKNLNTNKNGQDKLTFPRKRFHTGNIARPTQGNIPPTEQKRKGDYTKGHVR